MVWEFCQAWVLILTPDLDKSLKALSLSCSSTKWKAHLSSQVISSCSIDEPQPCAGRHAKLVTALFQLILTTVLGRKLLFLISIFQLERARSREAKERDQGHTANEW